MSDPLTQINNLLSQTDLSDWEKQFLSSIKEQYTKNNTLTAGQFHHLDKIGQRYTPEAIKMRDEWYASWNDEKKQTFKKVVDYYLKLHYFSLITSKARENPDYIPTQKEFDSLVNNKYAQRFLKNLDSEPKFKAGDLIQIRTNRYSGGEIGTIIEIKDISSWVEGSRVYSVNLLTEGHTRDFEERDIKKFRESALDKKKQVAV